MKTWLEAYRNSYFIDPWAAVAVYTDRQTHTQTHYPIPRLRMRMHRGIISPKIGDDVMPLLVTEVQICMAMKMLRSTASRL